MEPNPRSRTPPTTEPSAAPRRRHWGSVVALLLVGAIFALAWYLTHRAPPAGAGFGASASRGGGPGTGGPGARGGPPSTVGVALARHANIPVIIDALGTVTSAATVTVTPQVSGVITQVLYREGQLVRKGEVLATIDPQPFRNALDQAVGARIRDDAQLAAARLQLQRYQALLKEDSIAGQTVDNQAALVEQLSGTVAVDRAQEAAARLNLRWSRIVAPVSGRVGLRPIDAGNFIAAGSSTGVATITQVSPIDVAFAIPQERVPEVEARIASGAELPVTVWDSGRTRQLESGRFTTLDNQVDTATGTVRAKARFANADGALFPNQFVNVRLLLRTVESAVVVPVTALRHGADGDFVYVVSADDTVSLRSVKAGLSGVEDVAIAAGLAVGERVVTEGGDRLKEGMRIQVAGTRPAAPSASSAGRWQRGASVPLAASAAARRWGGHRASERPDPGS
jgi:membrane fusion protein, multidrug efflux system